MLFFGFLISNLSLFLSRLHFSSQGLSFIMADPNTNSVHVILDFLRRNRFTRAEAALRSEINNRPDLNGFIKKLTLEEKASRDAPHYSKAKPVLEVQGLESHDTLELSKELIVKEIECGNGRNATESKWKTAAPSMVECNRSDEVIETSDKNFIFSKSSEDGILDLYSWKFKPSNGPVELYQNDSGSRANNTLSLKANVSQQSKCQTNEAVDAIASNTNSKSGEEKALLSDKKSLWPGSSSKASVDLKYDLVQSKEPMELEWQLKFNGSSLKGNFTDNPWSRADENVNSSSDSCQECSVKTVFPFSKGDVSTSSGGATYSDNKEEKKRVEISDSRTSIKGQVDELGRAIYLVKTQGSLEQKMIGSLSFPLPPENQKEEFPRLPPVKLKSDDNPLVVDWEEKFERDGQTSKFPGADSTLLIGSYLDVPIGQEINPSG